MIHPFLLSKRSDRSDRQIRRRRRLSFINIVDRRHSPDERPFAAVHNRFILSLRSCQPAARSFMSVSRLVCALAPARARSLRLMLPDESEGSRLLHNGADSYFPARAAAGLLSEKFTAKRDSD